MANSEVKLHIPYPLQREIMRSHAKRKIIVAGRRSGKTDMQSSLAISDPYNSGGLLQGSKVLLLSASQDQADIYWDRITKWLSPIITHCYKNETKRIIRLDKGAIKVKTASDPDALKGFDADTVTLDECALLSPYVWFEAVAPMLVDRDGTATFISTPKRKNWFYQIYLKALADDTGRWQAWNFPSMANPHLSRTALEELASDMTVDMYHQEILAEFLESGGEVFKNLKQCATAQIRDPYPGNFVFGVDTAQKQDYTVVCVIDRDTHTMVDMVRFNKVDWSVYRENIRTLNDKWKPYNITFEINSVGSVVFEDLSRAGLPVIAFETTGVSKPPLIEGLAFALEKNELAILDDGILTGELAAYERKVSQNTGRSQYNAPEGLHDDCVIALALAWFGVQHSGSPISFAPNTYTQPIQTPEKITDNSQYRNTDLPRKQAYDPALDVMNQLEQLRDQEDLEDYLNKQW